VTDDTIRTVLDMLARLGLDHADHIARHVHLHPADAARLMATFEPAPTRHPWQTDINALVGLDIVTTTGQASGSYRITDQHGCLLADSRSGRTIPANPETQR
jgi:hypothetical protein